MGFDKKYLVALVAVALTAGWLNAGAAHAQSGRRLCVYGQYDAWRSAQVEVHGLAVVDYKKDGACPTVNFGKFFSAVGVPVPPANQPVPKITCEELSGKIGWEPWPGEDPCSRMGNDYVYRFQTLTDKGSGTVEHSWPTFDKIWDHA
jgi:hypothetical protein